MDHTSANAAALSLWAKSFCSGPSSLQGSCSHVTTPSLSSLYWVRLGSQQKTLPCSADLLIGEGEVLAPLSCLHTRYQFGSQQQIPLRQ